MLRLRRLTREERKKKEEGVVAVMVAIVMMLLLCFAAWAIDFGQIWANRTIAQNAADAAAMAAAQDCSQGGCGDTGEIVDFYSRANGASSGVLVTDTENSVTVRSVVPTQALLGPLMGVTNGGVTMDTTAEWYGLKKAKTVPVLMSMCDFFDEVGDTTGYPDPDADDMILPLRDTTNSCDVGLGSIPRGFYHVTPTDSMNCTISATATGTITSYATTSSDCSLQPKIVAGQTIVVGVFDKYNPTSKAFHLAGLAAFKVTGYCSAFGPTSMLEEDNPAATCSAATQHMNGHFVPFVTTQAVTPSLTAPNLGVTVIKLS